MCRTSIVLQLSAADHEDDGDDDVDGKRDDGDEDNYHHHHLGDDADIDECATRPSRKSRKLEMMSGRVAHVFVFLFSCDLRLKIF